MSMNYHHAELLDIMETVMRANDWSYYELAGRIGVQPTTIYSLRDNKRKPGDKVINGLAKVAGVTADIIRERIGFQEHSARNENTRRIELLFSKLTLEQQKLEVAALEARIKLMTTKDR